MRTCLAVVNIPATFMFSVPIISRAKPPLWRHRFAGIMPSANLSPAAKLERDGWRDRQNGVRPWRPVWEKLLYWLDTASPYTPLGWPPRGLIIRVFAGKYRTVFGNKATDKMGAGLDSWVSAKNAVFRCGVCCLSRSFTAVHCCAITAHRTGNYLYLYFIVQYSVPQYCLPTAPPALWAG
jgi:hypothetical protein